MNISPTMDYSEIKNCTSYLEKYGGNISEEISERTSVENIDLRVSLPGMIIFLLFLPFVLFKSSWCPIGSTCAVLLGSMFMIMTGMISQTEVFEIIGHKENLRAVFLLTGMMMLAQFFEREKLIEGLVNHIISFKRPFGARTIALVCFISFLLAALFTSDAASVILTPILLQAWKEGKGNVVELETLLLAIGTSITIGSVTTTFGNPSIAIIAARMEEPVFDDDRLDLRQSLIYLGPPALVSLVINIICLQIHYRTRVKAQKDKRAKELAQSSDRQEGIPLNILSQTDNNNLESQRDAVASAEDNSESRQGAVASEEINTESHSKIASFDSNFDIDQIDTMPKSHSKGADNVFDPSLVDTMPESHSKGADNVFDDPSLVETMPESHKKERKINPNPYSSWIPSSIKKGPRQSSKPRPKFYPLRFEFLDKFPLVRSMYSYSQTSRKNDITMSSLSITGFQRSLTGVSPTARFIPDHHDDEFKSSKKGFFHLILLLLLVAVYVLMLVSHTSQKMDIGLLPFGVAMLAITLDGLVNRNNAVKFIRRLDWSVFLMFFGYFVWMKGLNKTKLGFYLWKFTGMEHNDINKGNNPVQLVTFIILWTNILSNIPFTMIALEMIEPCINQHKYVLIITWCITIAGNLTIYGSAANLFVAQKGKEMLDYNLTFFKFWRYGFLTTIINAFVGTIIISFIVEFAG